MVPMTAADLDTRVFEALSRRREVHSRNLADALDLPTRSVLASLQRLRKAGRVGRRYRAATNDTTWRVL